MNKFAAKIMGDIRGIMGTSKDEIVHNVSTNYANNSHYIPSSCASVHSRSRSNSASPIHF